MQHKVELCGVNTSKLKVLKNEETRELLLRAKAGDKQAREELIAGNLRLVLSVIQRFGNRGENADDLFQVGCIGLIKAIDNFNTDLDVKFSTYGVPMIVGEIRRYLRDNSTMRVSRAMRDTAYKAVSYTHLDVYKRQLWGRLRGINCCPPTAKPQNMSTSYLCWPPWKRATRSTVCWFC